MRAVKPFPKGKLAMSQWPQHIPCPTGSDQSQLLETGSSSTSRLGKMKKNRSEAQFMKYNSWGPVRSSKRQVQRQAWNQVTAYLRRQGACTLGMKSHSKERQGWGQAHLGHSSPRTGCPELNSAGHPGCTSQGVDGHPCMLKPLRPTSALMTLRAERGKKPEA